jgi:ribosomal protein S18 acetylase RimI-like enzyme
MGSKITFRKAVSDDTAFIYQSLKDMALEQDLEDRFTLTEKSLWDALFSEKSFAEVIFALSDLQPIGLVLFSMTNRNFDLFSSSGIYVHDMYIQKMHRRSKIGSQFAEHIKKIARERNCCRIDWVVLKDNQTAIEFYKSMEGAKEIDYIRYMRITL